MHTHSTKFPKDLSKEHGGTLRKGKRKTARPFDRRKSMHIVLRSTHARGSWSMLQSRNKGFIHAILLDVAERFQIKIYNYRNVGNHLHLNVQAGSRKNMQSFLRVFPQRVMFQVTGACKGNPIGRFWDEIVWSRIVEWGREFKVLQRYFLKNQMQAFGFDRRTLYQWHYLTG